MLLFSGYLLSVLGSKHPELVELYYSKGIYPVFARTLALFNGWVPFSLAEILVVIIIGGAVVALVSCVFDTDWRGLGRVLVRILKVASVLYFLFVLLWGLNYSRLPFAVSAGFDQSEPSTSELLRLCENLISSANTLRTSVVEDAYGVMTLNGSARDVFARTHDGYWRAASKYPNLSARYGPPKAVVASKLMSYQGIGGIYMPYTGEANVNIAMPASSIPFTAAHEVAHQHGYAREEEANFIAYLTCSLHQDIDFRYSGALHALLYAMESLKVHDVDSFESLNATISTGVKRDIQAQRDYWQAHEGVLARFFDRLNDIFLKANRQKEGVFSYGRMVELLIAYYRQ